MAERIGMYSVYDFKAELFSPPFFMAREVMAKRAFQELANDKATTVGKHPGDFKLYHLGFFATESGRVETLEEPISLGVASDYVEVPKNG